MALLRKVYCCFTADTIYKRLFSLTNIYWPASIDQRISTDLAHLAPRKSVQRTPLVTVCCNLLFQITFFWRVLFLASKTFGLQTIRIEWFDVRTVEPEKKGLAGSCCSIRRVVHSKVHGERFGRGDGLPVSSMHQVDNIKWTVVNAYGTQTRCSSARLHACFSVPSSGRAESICSTDSVLQILYQR